LTITATPIFSFGRKAMYDGMPSALPLCQSIGRPW
jgi:hypothetical protein